MQRILITGATGYIGGKLASCLIETEDVRIRLLVRNPDKLPATFKEKADIVQGSTFEPEPLQRSLKDIQTAYYLIHSMGGGQDYREKDKESAQMFREACIAAGVKRIVYLGGLGSRDTASQHLLSRIETGEILSQTGDALQTIWFRAAVIIGAGSASFQIIRHLVKKLPIMITPRWVNTRTQPIGVDDVLDYLIQAKDLEYTQNLIVDIGSDAMSFRSMLETTAAVMKLKRWLLPVRVLTPRLSSYWLILMTPVNFNIAKELVEGLKTETLVENDNAERFFPDIHPLSFAESVQRAQSGNESS
jgi:uncharacterized protein YbjT (DUF2867 family)